MNIERLRDLAWEAVDSEPHDHALIVSPKEMLWLLRKWPRGNEVVAEQQSEWKSQKAGSS